MYRGQPARSPLVSPLSPPDAAAQLGVRPIQLVQDGREGINATLTHDGAAGRTSRYDDSVSKLVPIKTPLTDEVAVFVGTIQSQGYAVRRVDDPQVFRQAVRVEARRRGQRVQTGVTDQDPHVVWACDPSSRLSDEEHARADRRAANLLGALIHGSGVTTVSRIPRNTPD